MIKRKRPQGKAIALVLAFFSFFLLFLLPDIVAIAAQDDIRELAQTVFFSCNKHNLEQSYWDIIAATVEYRDYDLHPHRLLKRPAGSCTADPPVDALVWLGDAIYADTCSLFEGCKPASDMELIRSKFTQQRNAPEYFVFRQTCVRQRDNSASQQEDMEKRRVMGVWDDHDMGKNDGGAEYADKDAAQQLYLDFLGISKDDFRRQQKGVYSFEPVPFRALDQTNAVDSDVFIALNELQRLYDYAMCVLLLDVRYFRDPANASLAGDMLGEPQWAWLEQRLRNDVAGKNPITGKERCALTVVGSGVQIIMDEKVSESWGAFPLSRERLFALLRRYRTERVLFISGDVHLGEIGLDTTENAMEALGYPIVEVTSSGLTHSAGNIVGLSTFFTTLFPSPRRIGVYLGQNFGRLQLTVDLKAFSAALRNTDKLKRRQLEDYVNVSISIHSIPQDGQVVLQLTLSLSNLTIQKGVDSRTLMSLTAASKRRCDDRTVNSTACLPYYYPLSTPVPFFTRAMRTLRHYIWPQRTVLDVVRFFIYAVVMTTMGMVTLLFVVLWACCCRKNGKAKLA